MMMYQTPIPQHYDNGNMDRLPTTCPPPPSQPRSATTNSSKMSGIIHDLQVLNLPTFTRLTTPPQGFNARLQELEEGLRSNATGIDAPTDVDGFFLLAPGGSLDGNGSNCDASPSWRRLQPRPSPSISSSPPARTLGSLSLSIPDALDNADSAANYLMNNHHIPQTPQPSRPLQPKPRRVEGQIAREQLLHQLLKDCQINDDQPTIQQRFHQRRRRSSILDEQCGRNRRPSFPSAA